MIMYIHTQNMEKLCKQVALRNSPAGFLWIDSITDHCGGREKNSKEFDMMDDMKGK